MLTTPIPDNGL